MRVKSNAWMPMHVMMMIVSVDGQIDGQIDRHRVIDRETERVIE
jgi:hypothetical protein